MSFVVVVETIFKSVCTVLLRVPLNPTKPAPVSKTVQRKTSTVQCTATTVGRRDVSTSPEEVMNWGAQQEILNHEHLQLPSLNLKDVQKVSR